MSEAKPGSYVLDAFALLAYLQGEPGGEIVRSLVERADADTPLHLSLINLGETTYIIEREQGNTQAQRVLVDIRRMPLVLHDVGESRVLAAAHIKAHYPLSYADCFAAALAQELRAILVTGDPEFHALQGVIPVLWLTKGQSR